MDEFIVITFVIDFCLFFTFHFIIFRFLPQSRVFIGLILTFLLAIIAGLLIGLTLNNLRYHLDISAFIFSSAVVSFVYLNLAFFYTLAFFGIAVSSLRIRLLALIDKAGSTGITGVQIIKVYNVDNILKIRLKRLVDSEILDRIGTNYKIGNKFSYFFVHQYIMTLLTKTYPIKN